jgi:ArsR family transcriptional regulator
MPATAARRIHDHRWMGYRARVGRADDETGEYPRTRGGGRLSDRQAERLESVFKALADRNRVRIVGLLAAAEDAVCVCELMPALGVAQPTVSYHLKLLLDAGLVEREQRGRFGFYRLTPGARARFGPLVLDRFPGLERAA